jgi:hypothetical protein
MRPGPHKASLPGRELVDEGIADLSQGRITEAALLVLIAAPRLGRLGFAVPERRFSQPCEHLLYARLNQRLGTAAHSYYNSLIRRIVSFARALERSQQGRASVREK